MRGEMGHVPAHVAKENPGALAGATGEYSTAIDDLTKRNTRRASDASRVIDAVFACEPTDRLWLVEMIFDELRAHEPAFAADFDAMDWARRWAAIASRTERKAYCLATFEAMAEHDQRAFLAYVGAKVRVAA